MSKFFELKATVENPLTGGNFCMVHEVRKGYYNIQPKIDSWWNIKMDILPDFVPDLKGFSVTSGESLPDVITHNLFNFSTGLFFNERTKNIFEAHHLPEHGMFEASLIYKRKEISYYWMHLVCDLECFIDFPNSIWGVGNSFYRNIVQEGITINVQSLEDYRPKWAEVGSQFKGPHNSLVPLKIRFLPEFDRTLDIIYLKMVDGRILASERLVSALQSANITGLLYNEVDILDLS